MRLWHQSLLPYLSTKRLVRQHCECCALRGKGWGRKHATVNYVFEHSPELLVRYHLRVLHEMDRRNYKFDDNWLNVCYRGKELEPWSKDLINFERCEDDYVYPEQYPQIVYPEHDEHYLRFCLEHLDRKGEHIDYHD